MHKPHILVLLGHPDNTSFCGALADTYVQGAQKEHASVQLIRLGDLTFDPILHHGYNEIQALEPDLHLVQQAMLDASHIVIVHPVWWGSLPALLKGCIDRMLLPGFGFSYYSKNSLLWKRLLRGRSARIIYTSNSPWLYYRWIVGHPGVLMLKRAVLHFCGIRPVYVTGFNGIRFKSASWRTRALETTFRCGARDARKLMRGVR